MEEKGKQGESITDFKKKIGRSASASPRGEGVTDIRQGHTRRPSMGYSIRARSNSSQYLAKSERPWNTSKGRKQEKRRSTRCGRGHRESKKRAIGTRKQRQSGKRKRRRGRHRPARQEVALSQTSGRARDTPSAELGRTKNRDRRVRRVVVR